MPTPRKREEHASKPQKPTATASKPRKPATAKPPAASRPRKPPAAAASATTNAAAAPVPDLTDRQWRSIWKRLPTADKRFIAALSVLLDLVGDEPLRYCNPPLAVSRHLKTCDRHAHFSILCECLGYLTESPFMERMRNSRRRDSLSKSPARAFLG